MDVSFGEILGFSLLFAVPAAAVMLPQYAVFAGIAFKRKGGFPLLFHWIDFVMPIVATCIWCRFQTFSIHCKSMGNIAELGLLGLAWGAFFFWRGLLFLNGRKTSIWRLAVFECVAVVLLAVFAPTFPE